MNVIDAIILSFVFSSILVLSVYALYKHGTDTQAPIYEQMECDYDTGKCYVD